MSMEELEGMAVALFKANSWALKRSEKAMEFFSACAEKFGWENLKKELKK